MLRIFVIANYLQPQLQLPSGCLCSCVQEGHVLQPQLQVPLCPWLHDGQIFSASSMVKYIINNYPTTFHFYYNTRVKAFLHDKKTTSLGLFDTLFPSLDKFRTKDWEITIRGLARLDVW